MPDLSLVVSAIVLTVMVIGAVQFVRRRRTSAFGRGFGRGGGRTSAVPDDDTFVILGRFPSPIEAEAARALLESAGITSRIEHGQAPLVVMGIWVTLWVAHGDLEAAREALEGGPP